MQTKQQAASSLGQWMRERTRMLYNKDAVAFAMNIEGWMSEGELVWLSSLAMSLPDKAVWCELGVFKGRSWSCVALSLPDDSRIIGVDSFDGGTMTGSAPQQYVAGGMSYRSEFDYTLAEVKQLRPNIDCEIIVGDTAQSAGKVNLVDVVFIDGDHTCGAVITDIEAWHPKINPGGLLCGHDYTDPNVAEALRICGLEATNPIDSIWSVRMSSP